MSIIKKGAFLAAACLMGAAAITGPSQAGFVDNGLATNGLATNGLATNTDALVSSASEADIADMALNGIRFDGTTLMPVPDPVWMKDADPPDPD